MRFHARALLGFVALIAACDPSRPLRSAPDAAIACPAVIAPGDPNPASVWVESSCSVEHCVALASESACDLRLQLAGCADGELDAHLDTGIFNPSQLGTCTAPAPRSGAIWAAECTEGEARCRFDVYPATATLAADARALDLLGAQFFAPRGSSAQLLDIKDPFAGYFGGAAMIAGGDALAVSTYAGALRSLDCDESRAPPSRIILVDTEQLTVTASAAGPGCLGALARDPQSDGFLGAFGGAAPQIGRFDRGGALLASRAIRGPGDGVNRFVTAILGGEAGLVFVVLQSVHSAYTSYVAAIELDSLETSTISALVGGDLRSAALIESRTIAAADRFEGQLVLFDAVQLIPEPPVPLDAARRSSDDAGFVSYDPASGRVVIAATGSNAVLWTARGGTALGTAIFYERTAVPWASLRVSAGGPFLVGVTGAAPELEARLARFDAEELHYLPGSIALGRGVVAQLLEDRRRRVWATLPWSGAVVRVELR